MRKWILLGLCISCPLTTWAVDVTGPKIETKTYYVRIK